MNTYLYNNYLKSLFLNETSRIVFRFHIYLYFCGAAILFFNNIAAPL